MGGSRAAAAVGRGGIRVKSKERWPLGRRGLFFSLGRKGKVLSGFPGQKKKEGEGLEWEGDRNFAETERGFFLFSFTFPTHLVPFL